jgi:AhpD family alkylhydroperoxidase
MRTHAIINYPKVAPEPYRLLGQIRAWLDGASVDQTLRSLLEVRVSQINGCALCLDIHTGEARERGVPQQLLDVLSAWREAPLLFTDAQRAALAWAEAVTRVPEGAPPPELVEAMRPHFTDEQIVALSWAVIAMNAWNRLAVSFGYSPRPRREAR